jgi:hypothetical protein
VDIHQLARLPLPTGYVFENGTSFFDKLGEERAAALLKALSANGYFIVSESRAALTATWPTRIDEPIAVANS